MMYYSRARIEALNREVDRVVGRAEFEMTGQSFEESQDMLVGDEPGIEVSDTLGLVIAAWTAVTVLIGLGVELWWLWLLIDWLLT